MLIIIIIIIVPVYVKLHSVMTTNIQLVPLIASG